MTASPTKGGLGKMMYSKTTSCEQVIFSADCNDSLSSNLEDETEDCDLSEVDDYNCDSDSYPTDRENGDSEDEELSFGQKKEKPQNKEADENATDVKTARENINRRLEELIRDYKKYKSLGGTEPGSRYEWALNDIGREIERLTVGVRKKALSLGFSSFNISTADQRTYEEQVSLVRASLWKFIDCYDPKKSNAQFTTYLTSCVINEIRSALKKEFPYRNNDISLDKKVNSDDSDDEDVTIGTFVSDPSQDRVEKELRISEFEQGIFARYLKTLDPEERATFVFMMGALGESVMTQAQLGEFLGRAQPTIQQKFHSAQMKLKEFGEKYSCQQDFLQYIRDIKGDSRRGTGLAPYQAYKFEQRVKMQTLYDKGYTPLEISRALNIKKLEDVTSLVSRFERGEYRR